jgi:hypothetical protein
MQIQNATFVITHRKERFVVEMSVQDTSQNKRRAVVSVNDAATGKNLLHESRAGRQLICPETAKKAIKSVIKARNENPTP